MSCGAAFASFLVGNELARPKCRRLKAQFCPTSPNLLTTPRLKHSHGRLCVAAVAAKDDAAPSAPSSKETRRVEIKEVYETKGGWIVEADVFNFSTTTSHTVIVGKRFLSEFSEKEKVKIPTPESAVTWVFMYFLSIGFNISNTSGMLEPGAFPINYFSLRQVFYFFEDATAAFAKHIQDTA